MASYSLAVIKTRFENGWNYMGPDSCAYISSVSSAGVDIEKFTRAGRISETISAEEFSKNATLLPPVGGYSTYKDCLVYSSLLSLRHNNYNTPEASIDISAYPKILPTKRHFVQQVAFLPVYDEAETLLKNLRGGSVLGGALSMFLGIAIDFDDFPNVFYCGAPIGVYNTEKDVFLIKSAAWSWRHCISSAFKNKVTMECTE